MAAANKLHDLKIEATCAICLDYFKDPVTIDCGHNFCRSCITEYVEGSATHFACPQCREISQIGNMRPNKQLGNMVDIARTLQIPTVKPQDENLCEKHEETLRLFCEEDQKLICLVCRESRDHKSHTVSPIEEAAQEYKGQLEAWLHPLKKEMEGILESKLKEEKQYKTMRNKLETERKNIVAEFEGLRQLLKEQEQILLRRLDQMDKNITMVEHANIGKLSHKITSLSALIAEIGEKCKGPAWKFLKDARSMLSRCNDVKIPKPEEEMKTYKEPVTLDPDTAHPRLVLSKCHRRVRGTGTGRILLDNLKRFTVYPCVLGSKGITSGRHYWEVQLLQEGGWWVGAIRETVNRKGAFTLSPEGGVWAVRRYNYEYQTLRSPWTTLSLHESPTKLGVYLDYEGGRLSLYNADTMEHIYTFTHASFTQRLFPFFCIYTGVKMSIV